MGGWLGGEVGELWAREGWVVFEAYEVNKGDFAGRRKVLIFYMYEVMTCRNNKKALIYTMCMCV
jgi:hypothetical protein